MRGMLRLFYGILKGLVLVLAGVLMVTNQESFVKVIMVAAGLVTLAEGLYTLFSLKRWSLEKTTRTLAIVKGLVLVVLGILALVSPFAAGVALATTFCYVYATGLVFSAVIAMQNGYVIHKLDSSIKVSDFVFEALLDILIAVVFFVNPARIMGIAVTVIGVLGIVAGVAVIIAAFRFYRLEKRIVEP